MRVVLSTKCVALGCHFGKMQQFVYQLSIATMRVSAISQRCEATKAYKHQCNTRYSLDVDPDTT